MWRFVLPISLLVPVACSETGCSTPHAATHTAPAKTAPAKVQDPPFFLRDPRKMDPGELHPEGWFGYAFDFVGVSRLVPGMTLSDVQRELRGQPVARSANQDHSRSWIWYFETEPELDAVELVFADEKLVRVAETCHQVEIDYGAVPLRLQPDFWCDLWRRPPESGDELLLRPSRNVRGGSGYDRDATRQLAFGSTTLPEAERKLGGKPAWLVHFADGSEDAVWFQKTPTMATTYCGQFDARGVLQFALPDSRSGAMPVFRDANEKGSPRVSLEQLWK